MILQQRVFEFNTETGDKPTGKLLTSRVIVNSIPTEIFVSDLFHGFGRENNNTVKGYSILEFLDENSNMEINDKIYNITMITPLGEPITITTIRDPKDYILNDKTLTDDQEKNFESKIESSVPQDKSELSEIPMQQEQKTQNADATADENEVSADLPGSAEVVFEENQDYIDEKAELKQEGFNEYLTDPLSNYRALVGHDQLILIEIKENDYDVLNTDAYEIEADHDAKTFMVSKAEPIVLKEK